MHPCGVLVVLHLSGNIIQLFEKVIFMDDIKEIVNLLYVLRVLRL